MDAPRAAPALLTWLSFSAELLDSMTQGPRIGLENGHGRHLLSLSCGALFGQHTYLCYPLILWNLIIADFSYIPELAGPRDAKELPKATQGHNVRGRPCQSEGFCKLEQQTHIHRQREGLIAEVRIQLHTEFFKERLHKAGPRVEVRSVHIQVGNFFGCQEKDTAAVSREGPRSAPPPLELPSHTL